MLILSHRGIEYAPNSLRALNEALKRGFSLETDLRLSKDGIVMIVHDQNLSHSFGIDVNVRDCEYQKLISKDKIFQELIPSFEGFAGRLSDLLKPGQVIALHIKDYDNLDLIYKACQEIKDHKLEKQVFIFNVLLKDIQLIKKRYPMCKIGVSVGEKNYGPAVYTFLDIKSYLESIDIIWADEWQEGLYNSDFFNYCKDAKKEIYVISPELHKGEHHPFSGNPEALWNNIASYEFDGICTDFPQKALTFFNRPVAK